MSCDDHFSGIGDYLVVREPDCILSYFLNPDDRARNSGDECRAGPNGTAIALRIDAMKGAGEGDGLPDMVETANPGDGAFDTHAESAVRDAAVAA